MDMIDLAQRLGNPDDLAAMVSQLRTDATGDNPIEDGHPRFGEHVAFLGWASDTWEHIDLAIDRAAQAANAHRATNAVTQDAADRVLAEIRAHLV